MSCTLTLAPFRRIVVQEGCRAEDVSCLGECERVCAGEWHTRPLKETNSSQAAPQRAHFKICDEESLRRWVHAQMHARQMLIRRPSLVAKNTTSSEPFPGVTYESSLYKQFKSKNLAGNGKTFLVRLRHFCSHFSTVQISAAPLYIHPLVSLCQANLLEIWREAPEDEPAASWQPSGSFDLIRKVMINTYNPMYLMKIRPKLARRAEEPGLHPARDADKENAGVPHVH